jgi:hypothetical protein
MRSLRSHEGYLQVDHRDSPGFTEAEALAAGLNPKLVRGGQNVESATITCSHCQRIVVLNPDRTRSRGYCPKCDHYVCDECEAARVASGYACLPHKVREELAVERVIIHEQRSRVLLVPGKV